MIFELNCLSLNLIGSLTFQTKSQKNVRSLQDRLSPGGVVRSGYETISIYYLLFLVAAAAQGLPAAVAASQALE